MLRLYYFGALLGVAAILPAPICAQMPAPNSVTSGARVQHVVVHGTGDAMEVEIQTSGAPVEPDTQAIPGPDRIVVDFPGALPAAELRALKVNRGALKAVRTGLFFDNPPITRVVLDLAEPQSYRVSTSQNTVVIKLGSATAGAHASECCAHRKTSKCFAGHGHFRCNRQSLCRSFQRADSRRRQGNATSAEAAVDGDF